MRERVDRGGALKRHRAAALQDAGAFSRALHRPQGLGVRQPYAAFRTKLADPTG